MDGGRSDGEEAAIAAELTALMSDIDGGFFGRDDRAVAERYWDDYLEPEIERLFTPGVVFHSHYEGPGGGTVYEGYAGLRRWADDVTGTFARFVRRNETWEGVGDRALLVHQRIEATGRESGAEIELRLWVLWRLDRGRIHELRTFADRYEAVAAAGELPVPLP